MTSIAPLLGDKAESLLGFSHPRIAKERLHLPGPDVVDRLYAVSDRNNRVLGNLQRIVNHGRLAGTGYLSILPVDQGIEHSGGASFARNPDYFDPENIVKLQGEYITRSLKVPWVIVRTILVYGITPSMNRSNLVTWVRDSLNSNKPIRVVNDQFRMPTLVDDLVGGIFKIIERNKTGIYHLSGPKMISVHDFAIKTAQVFELDLSLISPIKSEVLNQPGRRPVSTGFILDKAIDDLDYSPHNLDDGLQVVRNLLAEYSV